MDRVLVYGMGNVVATGVVVPVVAHGGSAASGMWRLPPTTILYAKRKHHKGQNEPLSLDNLLLILFGSRSLPDWHHTSSHMTLPTIPTHTRPSQPY